MTIPPIRHRFRILLATGLLLLAFSLQVLWTGTRQGPVPATPTNPGTTVAALVTGAAGQRELWASRVLSAPLPVVYGALTDYPSFARMFPGLERFEATPLEGNQHKITGLVRLLGTAFPFETQVHHEPGDTEAKISWDYPTEALSENRGSWNLVAVPGGTRVTYKLRLRVTKLPEFLSQAYLVGHIGFVLDGLANELAKRGGGAS